MSFGASWGSLTMTDLAVHDGSIFAFTMVRNSHSPAGGWLFIGLNENPSGKRRDFGFFSVQDPGVRRNDDSIIP
jgi:hypothetical protein